VTMGVESSLTQPTTRDWVALHAGRLGWLATAIPLVLAFVIALAAEIRGGGGVGIGVPAAEARAAVPTGPQHRMAEMPWKDFAVLAADRPNGRRASARAGSGE